MINNGVSSSLYSWDDTWSGFKSIHQTIKAAIHWCGVSLQNVQRFTNEKWSQVQLVLILLGGGEQRAEETEGRAELKPTGAAWRRPPGAMPRRIPVGTQTCSWFPTRDSKLLFITRTAKELWTQICDCLEDPWSSLTPFVCATSAGTKLMSQKPILSTKLFQF